MAARPDARRVRDPARRRAHHGSGVADAPGSLPRADPPRPAGSRRARGPPRRPHLARQRSRRGQAQPAGRRAHGAHGPRARPPQRGRVALHRHGRVRLPVLARALHGRRRRPRARTSRGDGRGTQRRRAGRDRRIPHGRRAASRRVSRGARQRVGALAPRAAAGDPSGRIAAPGRPARPRRWRRRGRGGGRAGPGRGPAARVALSGADGGAHRGRAQVPRARRVRALRARPPRRARRRARRADARGTRSRARRYGDRIR